MPDPQRDKLSKSMPRSSRDTSGEGELHSEKKGRKIEKVGQMRDKHLLRALALIHAALVSVPM